jgi:3,4-dihydroxy 2-butanone 4-phosphate synthase/GTP cyclohydrolase II
VAIDPTKTHDDIVSPGHVFPLTAREGGVLVRAGHTEAGVDIARLAGLLPASVICEIMNDDGSMARLPDLVAFAQHHNLKIGTIADLIAYRRLNDHMIERVLDTPFETRHGVFNFVLFRNRLDGAEHVALTRGAMSGDRDTLVRMHRVDFAADIIGDGSDRTGMIDRALSEIAGEADGGALVLLRNLDPLSLSRRFGAAAPDVPIEERMLREYGVGAQILRELGVRRMVLLSNAPQKIIGLEGYGLTIAGWRPFKGG